MDENDIFNMHSGNDYDDNNNKKMPFEKKYLIGITVVSIILVIVMTMVGVFIGMGINNKKTEEGGFIPINPTININGSTELGVGVQDVTKEVENSVVQISCEEPGPYGQVRLSRGSGVIFTDTGFIVTNEHVIAGAQSPDNITVTLADGREFVAKSFKRDNMADIGYVKIEASNLKAATIGNSDELKKGEQVVVIGNPLGTLGGSVTDGILSALDRNIIVDNRPMRLLQTNAEINPGNSGGGMFNMKSELIGIVNAKSTATEIEGIGFAIPINTALKVFNDLKEFGYVKGRVTTGIVPVEILSYRDMFTYFGGIIGDEIPALYVYDISSKLANKINRADKIVAVGNVSVHSLQEYNIEICKYNIGDTVKFTFNGADGVYTVDIKLDEYRGE